MYTTLLKVRYQQLRYELGQLSLLNKLLAVLLVLAAISGSWYLFRDATKATYGAALIALIVLSVHISRKDKRFVNIHLRQPVLSMYMEYAMISLPLTLPLAFSPRPYLFILLELALLAICTLTTETKAKASLIHISRYIPPANFEWISGIRKSRYFIIPLYLLAVVCSWLPFVPLVLLWLCTASIISFYIECEPLSILTLHSGQAASLLRGKILSGIKLLSMFYAPVLFINLVFQYQFWYVSLLFLPLQCLVITFAIVYKYKLYQPRTILQGNTVLTSLGLLSAVLPFLLPLPAIMTIMYYKPAINNLSTYLDDQD